MRALKVLREVERRQSRRALGVPPFGGRLVLPRARSTDLAPDILALPEKVDDLAAMQTANGGFIAMIGFSGVGGPDTVG